MLPTNIVLITSPVWKTIIKADLRLIENINCFQVKLTLIPIKIEENVFSLLLMIYEGSIVIDNYNR